jgi:hypothetical protein
VTRLDRALVELRVLAAHVEALEAAQAAVNGRAKQPTGPAPKAPRRDPPPRTAPSATRAEIGLRVSLFLVDNFLVSLSDCIYMPSPFHWIPSAHGLVLTQTVGCANL